MKVTHRGKNVSHRDLAANMMMPPLPSNPINVRSTGHTVFTSTERWAEIDVTNREAILLLLESESEKLNTAVIAEETFARQALLDAGATINQLSTDQRAAFVEAMQPLWLEYEDEIGVDLITQALSSTDSE